MSHSLCVFEMFSASVVTRALPVFAADSTFVSFERASLTRVIASSLRNRSAAKRVSLSAQSSIAALCDVWSFANVAWPRSRSARKPRTRSSAYASRRPRSVNARLRARKPRKHAWMTTAASSLRLRNSRSLNASSSFSLSGGNGRRAAIASSFRFSRSLRSRRAARRAAADATAIAEIPELASPPSANKESKAASSSKGSF